MFDTVIGSIVLDSPLPTSPFEGWRSIADPRGHVIRYWHNSTKLHLTYYLFPDSGKGRLQVEVSFPSLIDHDRRGNLSHDDCVSVVSSIDRVLDNLGFNLPFFWDWRCRRVDYAWNWPITSSIADYLDLVNGLHHGSFTRHVYPKQGVTWKSANRRGKWVKFYDKTAQLGDTSSERVLRFEVSNYAAAVDYMAARWFGCEPTVGEMLHPVRAVYCMASAWSRLGLDDDLVWSINSGEDLPTLRAAFGRAAPMANYVRALHHTYGNSAVARGLVSRSTYYAYVKRLRECGQLSHSSSHVVSLTLPIRTAVASMSDSTARLLENFESQGAKSPHKFVWENLPGLAPTAPKIPYIERLLNE